MWAQAFLLLLAIGAAGAVFLIAVIVLIKRHVTSAKNEQ